ncbi:MAG: 50S ribosomal protein L25 [Chloroflexi bacterium]|nr:50S ribosomal protein L25 [Chloroflexota bacterium]
MADIVLAAEPRTIMGKQVSQLRRKGLVPVVLYGHHREPQALQIEGRALLKTLKQAGGFRLVKLQIDGQPHMSLARDVQQHPLTRTILHADFQEVIMSEKITLSVPLHFSGDSSAVKAGLGMILRSRESVQIEALPADLIDSITVDLAQLTTTNLAIHVKDLKVPETVRIITDGGETVTLIVAMKEETLTEATEETTAEVEIIKKEKVAEGEEEEGAEEKK